MPSYAVYDDVYKLIYYEEAIEALKHYSKHPKEEIGKKFCTKTRKKYEKYFNMNTYLFKSIRLYHLFMLKREFKRANFKNNEKFIKEKIFSRTGDYYKSISKIDWELRSLYSIIEKRIDIYNFVHHGT